MNGALFAWVNAASEVWWRWMVHMSWQVAVLAAILLPASLLFRRSAAGFRYLLWSLVFVKLILPPVLATPWSPGNVLERIPVRIETAASTDEAPRAMAPGRGASEIVASMPAAEPDPAGIRESLAVPADAVPPAPPAKAAVPVNVYLAAMVTWLAVSSALFAVLAYQWFVYWRTLRRDLRPAPEEVQAVVEAQAKALGVANVTAWVSEGVSTPGVFGVWRARLLLPPDCASKLAKSQLEAVIAHEMAHIKRGDLAAGWATTLLNCLYWFHPVVWLVNLYLRREREMACDDMVLHSTKQDSKDYAKTLLKVAESYRRQAPAGAGMLGLLEPSGNLLQRIQAVRDPRRARRLGWGSLVVLAAAALCLPMGVWAAPHVSATVEEEIVKHYEEAAPEVRDFLRWTAGHFEAAGLWLPENALDGRSKEERAKLAEGCAKTLAEAVGLLDKEIAWEEHLRGQILVDTAEGRDAVVAMLEANPKLRLLGSERVAPEALAGMIVPLREDDYLVTFAPAAPFKPRDARALLKVFNENHPKGVRTGYYRTFREDDGSLVGHIIVSGGEGKDAIVAMLEAEDRLRCVKAEAVTRELFMNTSPYREEFLVEAYDVTFAPIPPFDPKNGSELLAEFNADYPMGVRTHHFTTRGRGAARSPREAFRRPELHKALALAGVLKDKSLTDDLIRVALYRHGKRMDNRARWIAAASLGRMGDEKAVPALVRLVDQYNKNTRMWARASLVRLTGQRFGADKTAWATWWNGTGKAPRIDLSTLNPAAPSASSWATRILEETGAADDRLGRMRTLNAHMAGFMGTTQGHEQFTLPAEDLEAILRALGEEGKADHFLRGADAAQIAHAFREDSAKTFDDQGNPKHLSWWDPWKQSGVEYVWWRQKGDRIPPLRIRLQISDAGGGRKLVYARYDGDEAAVLDLGSKREPEAPAVSSWAVEVLKETGAAHDRLGEMRTLNAHIATYMGMTLGHEKFTMPSEDLAAILDAVDEGKADYSARDLNATQVAHPFGKNSAKSFDGDGNPKNLSWWRPSERTGVAYVLWSQKGGRLPHSRIYFQISDGGGGRKLVYARLEEE